MAGVIFASDLHVSDYIWRSYPGLTGDSYYGLTQVIDLSIERQSPLILPGDILELLHTGSPSSRTVAVVNAEIERMRERKLPVYYISGNHDTASPSWLESINPWAIDLHLRSVEIDGRKWFGINNQRGDSLAQFLDQIPSDCFGLVVHQRWKEFDGGSTADGELSHVVSEAPNLKCIVSGDLHMWRVQTIAGCTCVSPGATHRRTVTEPTQHFVMHLDAGGEISKLELKSRPGIEVVARNVEQWARIRPQLLRLCESEADAAIARGVPPEICTPLVVVEDQGGVNAYEETRQLLLGKAFVMARSSTLKAGPELLEGDALLDFLDDGPTAAAVASEGLDDVLDRVLTQYFGQGSPAIGIAKGVFAGQGLETLRETFLKEDACDDIDGIDLEELCPALDLGLDFGSGDSDGGGSDGQREDESDGGGLSLPF